MWPGLKLVHGKPRHSQSQGSVERSNQDVRDMLVAWMLDNNTKQWSEGLRFIQSKKNRSLHEGIKKSPYEAMFGMKQRIGLADSSLEKETYESLETEEDLERILDGITTGPDNETEDNLYNTDLCAICEECGILVTCQKCSLKVHVKCGIETEDQVVCSRCNRTDAIRDQREDAKSGLEKQAAKMLSLSCQKLPPAEVGQNVVVKVPDVDRGRLAPRNVLAAVLSVNKCGLYKLGTKNGELERLYSRNEFTFADSNFIKLSEVLSTLLNLRQASVLASGSKQGFVMCNCKRYCISKKCNCRSKEVLCNSKCHNNSECKNK
ncbi:SCAN domain-containing protein 3-like [Temnothorax curvispinosus]|uniref:SCAN domain-containing protein 3-like n=1 Tax=Temnothorax curvispinosus TaxID=300111 RepID=A0A6J1QAN4_9HYME|nr:SCAN domain-containing protein 3-like [Temnothorax curvispinosus]